MRKRVDLNQYKQLLEKEKNTMKITIKNARLAFPNIFKAQTFEGSEPAFSASFILPPNHPQIKEIEAAIDEVAHAKWKEKAPAILKQMRAAGKTCLQDGDSKAEYDGYAGNKFVNARNKTKPLVIDKDKTELGVADGKPYGGCYVNASIELWAQDNSFGKRVNASLRGVQFHKDGDAFSGGGSASADEFDATDGADEDDLV